MAFELVVATKRDPGDTVAALKAKAASSPAQPLPVATIDVSGRFSVEHASELAQRVALVLESVAESVVIRFETSEVPNPEALVCFSRSIDRLRREGHDIRISAGDRHVHALLTKHVISSDAVIDCSEANGVARRRSIDAGS